MVKVGDKVEDRNIGTIWEVQCIEGGCIELKNSYNSYWWLDLEDFNEQLKNQILCFIYDESRKCDCGATKCNSPAHAYWCSAA